MKYVSTFILRDTEFLRSHFQSLSRTIRSYLRCISADVIILPLNYKACIMQLHPSIKRDIQGFWLLCSSIITLNEFKNKCKIDESAYWRERTFHIKMGTYWFIQIPMNRNFTSETFHTWRFVTGIVSCYDDELIFN